MVQSRKLVEKVVSVSAILLAMTLVWSCAPKGKKKTNGSASIVTECVLPPEQAHSLSGKWAATPIKVSFKQGDWNGDEMNAITAGGGTWNTFFTQSHGINPLNISPSNLSLANQSIPSCGSGTITDGAVIYKRFSNWTKSRSAVAVTTTCYNTRGTTGIATIFNAIMEFNYQYFFTQNSGMFPDLQSIATHELGHLLGLDHSCGPLGAPNQNQGNVGCPNPSNDPTNELLSTVMYYTVFFDGSEGEVKRDLAPNDQGRANCLYP